MINKEDYLNFIDKLTPIYSKLFGGIWWYSLISEKNPNKSMVFHNLIKGNIPREKFTAIKSILLGIKKYFSFVVRHFLFGRYYERSLEEENIFITYDNQFMFPFTESDGLHIYLPQKNKWREYKYDVTIDRFVSFFDLLKLFLLYFAIVLDNIFCLKIYKLKKDIKSSFFPYKIFKDDIWRSFAGDVLVEGLFYEIAFDNTRRKFPKLKKVIYPYEGQVWEKALNIKKRFIKTVGILCSTPSDNTLNFWYSEEEVESGMPVPDYLGVPGENLKNRFDIYKEDYLNKPKVFIIGSMRFRHIQDMLEKKEEKIIYDMLVIMPSNEQMALELFNWILGKGRHGVEEVIYSLSVSSRKKIIIKHHPDNRKDLFKFEGDITLAINSSVEDLLGKSKTIVSFDSSVEFMALALGKQVISPSLPSFISMNTIDKEYIGVLINRYGISPEGIKVYINNYFDFSKDEREELDKI